MRFLDTLLAPPSGPTQWIVFVLFAGCSLVLAWVGVREHVLQRRLLLHARPVDAIVVASEVITSKSADTDSRLGRDNSTTTHRPEIRFAYDVDGRRYESDMLYPNVIIHSYASRESAAEVTARYPVGAKITAFVDPTLPDRGFLQRERGAGPLVFMLVGFLLVPVLWWAVRLV